MLQAIIGGLTLGSVYALIALGFNLTYTTTRTLNFAQGDFVSVGAFVGLGTVGVLTAALGADAVGYVWFYALAAVAAALAMGVLGLPLYLAAIRPFAGKPGMSWVVSTIGFGIVLQSAALSLWGLGARMLAPPFGDEVFRVGEVGFRSQELVVMALAFAILGGFDIAMRRTALGRCMRAVALNRDAAALMGIDVPRVMALAFLASSALAGLSGVLVAPILSASLFMGVIIALKGFSAAIIGGLTNPRGCMAGGLLIGLVESLTALWSAQWREIMVFLLVILVLAMAPNGMFGRKLVEKV
ncbi:branched-chain amino acid ABC transporter permease [Azospirillum agricola]|uniref:branched-chain amino acid ABC transporter permease n=1 Tax=Azospirillum agricola TaxID=1720247 RepID=UPI000A0F22BB|nr:branched-chain amino acid ABC transporter permease [Azospirillum agricola]MBP2231270.1 branched-chain amino acid transport system permease protein [Azospirillum agricola]SMH62740.1 amino acid/amide ABC transporter membrane protein 1, HAAT family [Azospirillum lipoferum]